MRAYRASIIACVLVALVIALSFALTAYLRATSAAGDLVVRVHDGNGAVHEFSLHKDGQHQISTALGHNTIGIEDGSVRMIDADCPHQSCLDQEPIDAPGAQIICLPHKLWVEVAPAGSDGQAGLDSDLVSWSDQEPYDTVAR